MTTIQDVIGDYTPLSNNIVKKIGLIRGAVACKIFFASNLHDRVCRMGIRRIADELGIDHTTTSKTLKWLVDERYIEQIRPPTNRVPAHYRCSQKFYDYASRVDLINPRVDVVNPRVDLINKEEEIKEETKVVGPLTQKLLTLCQVNYKTLTRKQKQNLAETVDILQGIGCTEDALESFTRFWSDNWRGKNGPPALLQVPETWGEFEAWQDTQPKTRNGRIVHKIT